MLSIINNNGDFYVYHPSHKKYITRTHRWSDAQDYLTCKIDSYEEAVNFIHNYYKNTKILNLDEESLQLANVLYDTKYSCYFIGMEFLDKLYYLWPGQYWWSAKPYDKNGIMVAYFYDRISAEKFLQNLRENY